MSIPFPFLLLLLPFAVLHAQPEVDWLKVYGTNEIDVGIGLTVRPDLGYAVVGDTRDLVSENSAHDFMLILIDSVGTEVGRYAYGEGEYQYQSATCIQSLEDSTYVVSGVWDDYGFAMCVDDSGEVLWQTVLEEYGSGYLRDMRRLPDGNFLICGVNYSNGGDLWLLGIDSDGDVIFSELYGGDGNQSGNEAIQCSDGGYLIVGYGDGDEDNSDVVTLKVNANFEEEWTTYFGTEYSDYGTALIEDLEGNYIIGGTTKVDRSDYDLLAKLNIEGELVWLTSLGGRSITSLVISSLDGNIIAAGGDRNSYIYLDGRYREAFLWIVKVDRTGEVVWEFNGEGGVHIASGFNRLLELPDYSYVAAGTTQRHYRYSEPYGDNFVLCKTLPDPLVNGEIELVSLADTLHFGESWLDSTISDNLLLTNLGERFGLVDSITIDTEIDSIFAFPTLDSHKLFPFDTLSIPITFTPRSPEQYLATMNIWLPKGENDVVVPYLVVVLSGEGKFNDVDDDEIVVPSELAITAAYPNPFNAKTSITFTLPSASPLRLNVYDLSGRLVQTLLSDRLSAGTHTTIWDATDLPSGQYIVRLKTAHGVKNEKIVLLK